MGRIIDRIHWMASHALSRLRLDIPNRYSVSSNERSFPFLPYWDPCRGINHRDNRLYSFSACRIPLWIIISFRKNIKISTTKDYQKKKEGTTNDFETTQTRRRIVHPSPDIAQLIITANVMAIRRRGRAKSRGPRFIDYSSRHKWRGRAGNSGNSSVKLAPQKWTFLSCSINQSPPLRFLSRCERNEQGHRDRNTRDSLPCLPSF